MRTKKKNVIKKVNKKAEGCANIVDTVILSESPINEICRKVLKETQKHELICAISQYLGSSPSNLAVAEKIFEDLKFEIAKYIIHHEYHSPNGVSTELLLWLDSKSQPAQAKSFGEFICKYLINNVS
ncbi:MAG: hypothetical protein N2316_02735 [Spirochaetes bacterium]|nr:hypothetical protein [Spirochaetota bacterium]